jgi:iron complex transport system substrate-binding protein
MKYGLCSARKIFSGILIVLFITCTGCNRNAGQAPVREDGIRRIISAAPSNTEILIGLGLGERLIAVDPYSKDIPGVAAGLPEIDFFHPDTEAIIGLDPDLILTNEINSFGVADNPFKLLGDLGIKVVQVPTSTSIEGIYRDILFVAEALEVKDRGEAVVKAMKEEIDGIAAAGKEVREKKSVYFEVSGAPTLVSLGRGTYLNEMIEIAGGINIFADQQGWFSASAEEIINRNPDIIFAFAYSAENPVSEIMNRRAFESINAIRLNQVYAIDADSASRPSQNIVLALRQIAQVLSP